MRLQNIRNAVVDDRKVTDYLLAEESSSGKAEFFARYGYNLSNWTLLQSALLLHAREYDVVRALQSPFGMKYIIEGRLVTPDGRNPMVRTVWIIEEDSHGPRFVTAYPVKGERID